MGCNCSTYFKNGFLTPFFWLTITSAAVSRVPTLISSKRYHKYTYSRDSHVKILFKKMDSIKMNTSFSFIYDDIQ